MTEHIAVQTRALTIEGPPGDLEVLEFVGTGRRDSAIVVLPNGYGVLGYTRSVARTLAQDWSVVLAVNLRGQGDSDGVFSVPGCVEDVEAVIPRLGEMYGSLRVIAHCSAFLYLLDLPSSGESWRWIDRLILYAYLAEPTKHVDRFVERARRYGTRFASSLGDLERYTPDRYARLPVPFSVVHPQTRRNLQRATVDQVNQLASVAKPVSVSLPQTGYEISDNPQEENVHTIVRQHFNPLLLDRQE